VEESTGEGSIERLSKEPRGGDLDEWLELDWVGEYSIVKQRVSPLRIVFPFAENNAPVERAG